MMKRSFDARLSKLEQTSPELYHDQVESCAPMLQALVDQNGGRLDGESYASATARLMDMAPQEFIAVLRSRAGGGTL